MDERVIEPGLLRIFRNYCKFAICYFLGNFLYVFITTGEPLSALSLLYLANLLNFLFLLVLLYCGWLERKIRKLYLPITLSIATLGPIFSSAAIWPLQFNDPLTDIVIRSWTLFPILIVPIVLVAWQYSLTITLALVVLTALYDLPFIYMSASSTALQLLPFSFRNAESTAGQILPFIGVPILRSIALGMVGTIVSLLIKTQRTQRRRLMEANVILSEHAYTLEQLAVSRERNRLARELHDTLAHTLSSQVLTLEALKLSVDPQDQELNHSLNQLIDNSRHGLDETRRALNDLRARHLEDLGLVSALKNLLQEAASRGNCTSSYSISDTLPLLSAKQEQVIYRIAQEAMENIIRHANAKSIALSLQYDKSLLILEISDDGSGFNQEEIENKNRLGIKGMRERAADIGGTFSLETKPGHGTTIQVKFGV
jgi:signal transduction histidine kinase